MYSVLLKELKELSDSGAEVGVIGKSRLGQAIPYIRVGHGSKKIVITGGIHGREYITSALVVRLARRLYDTIAKCSVYFVPFVNPDGIRLSSEGSAFIIEEAASGRLSVDASKAKQVVGELQELNRGKDFRLWKANAAGVDLNVNFDADWGKGKSNVFYPRSSDYVGRAPLSEPESSALAIFTLKLRPCLTLSYHSKGEVIYWYFNQREKRLWRDYTMAKQLARLTGYSLRGREGSAGGYKDWCVSALKIPAFTLETGKDSLSHPIGLGYLDQLFEQNKEVPSLLCELAHSRSLKAE